MMKILVIDDEKGIQRLFEQRFRQERRQGKIEIDFAFSGREALDYFEKNGTIDLALVLSDINMPQMNGLELLKILKQNYPELKIFMITAYGDDENHRKAIEFGAEDYFTKPINFNLLKEKIFV